MTRPSDSVEPQFGGHRRRRRSAGVAVALTLALALALPGAVPAHDPVASASVAAVSSATVASTTDRERGRYELLGRSGRAPMRWLACRPIAYRINTAGMPKGMGAVVKASMAVVAEQTGVAFRYAGRTERAFSATAKPRVPTIFISFTAKRKAYGQRFSWPGEIGAGGPTGAWATDGEGRVFEAITSGRVLLSTRFRGPRRGAGATWQSLIVHEVGHALNLAHRGRVRDAMHASLTSDSPGRFRPAELAALKAVLQTRACDYAAWAKL